MTRINFVAMMSLSAALLAGLFFLSISCEKRGAKEGDEFSIDPSEVTLAGSNRTVILTAVGGTPPFGWTVSDKSVGSLSGPESTADRRVTYTRTDKNGANTVRATDGRGWFADCNIVQIGDTSQYQQFLSILPSKATISTNDSVVLQAIGGTGTYSWGIAAPNPSGYLSQLTGPMTIYTSFGTGIETIWLSDGQDTVFATITKQ